MFNSLNCGKEKRTYHGLFAEVTVDASHFVLVHLVQLGMNLETENLFNLIQLLLQAAWHH